MVRYHNLIFGINQGGIFLKGSFSFLSISIVTILAKDTLHSNTPATGGQLCKDRRIFEHGGVRCHLNISSAVWSPYSQIGKRCCRASKLHQNLPKAMWKCEKAGTCCPNLRDLGRLLSREFSFYYPLILSAHLTAQNKCVCSEGGKTIGQNCILVAMIRKLAISSTKRLRNRKKKFPSCSRYIHTTC